MKSIVLFSITVLTITVTVSCKKEKNSNIPSCLQATIDSSMAKPAGSLYTSVTAYTYQGTTVYLLMAGCCDRFDEVRNENCGYLFSPSGGIAGGGDRTHPDFFTGAKFLDLIWKDPRQ
jgi:hypothetical protein